MFHSSGAVCEIVWAMETPHVVAGIKTPMNALLEETFDDNGDLSPWWLRIIGIVMVIGFGLLLTITLLAYRNAPPILGSVVDARGQVLFTGDDVSDGQAVFLKYGLMDNGSIWGHGAYLGPDFSADALHRMGTGTAQAIAEDDSASPSIA